MTPILHNFIEALLAVDKLSCTPLMDDQLQQVTPIRFIEEVIVASLEKIGAGWQEGTYA